MNFAFPMFLAAAGFALAPVIIHMIARQRFKAVDLPTISFLPTTEKRNIIRFSLIDIFLLILRVLAILLIALAFANPISPASDQGNPLPIDTLIVIDDSPSMARLGKDGRPLIDSAREAATRILSGLPEGGNIAVVALSRIPSPTFALDRAKATSDLDAIRITPSPPHGKELLASGVDKMFSAGAAKGGDAVVDRHREIFLFTDLCKNALDRGVADLTAPLRQEDGSTLAGVNMYIVNVGTSSGGTVSAENLAVSGVRVSQPKITPDMPLRLGVEVVNHGKKAVKDIRVQLTINDKPIGKKGDAAQKIALQSGETRMVEFLYMPILDGVITARAWLETKNADANAVSWDDEYWFCLPVHQSISVLCIDGDESGRGAESHSLSRAIQASARNNGRPFFTATSVRASRAEDRPLFLNDVVAMVNPGKLPGDTIRNTVEFIEGGGGLVLFLGEYINQDMYRGLAEAVGSDTSIPFIPIQLGQIVNALEDANNPAPVFLSQVDYTHPIFQGFRDPSRGDPSVLAAFKYWNLIVPEDVAGVDVVARFSNGAPAIIERRFGRGKIIIVATTPNRRWTNFPTRAVWVPFSRALIRAAGRVRPAPRRFYFAGTPFQFFTDADDFAMRTTILTPDGSPLPIITKGGELDRVTLGRAGAQAGIYPVRLERDDADKADTENEAGAQDPGQTVDAFAVNVPPSESLLDAFTVAEIKTALGKNAAGIHVYNGSDKWYDDVLDNRRGSQLGWHLLVALLILLTIESLFAFILKPKWN